jgi:phosphate uptake regulator
MDIRNIQKTGNMYYIYLPTAWVKKLKINQDSKVHVKETTEGSLIISSDEKASEKNDIELNIKNVNMDVLNKIIVACYINPTKSFKITLDKPIDFEDMIIQKKLVTAEFIDFDGKVISCESSMTADDPLLLLRTMIKKIKSMVYVINKKYNKELIERYEEDIDRSKMLIEKSAINIFTNYSSSKTGAVYLYYISLITKNLERFVDHMRLVERTDNKYLYNIQKIIDQLTHIFLSDDITKNKIRLDAAILFASTVTKLNEIKLVDRKSYDKKRVNKALLSMSEIILDWAITSKSV